MEEIWKPVPGWEGLYLVSSLGRVRSLPRMIRRREGNNNNAYHLDPGRILKPRPSSGYYTVNLCGYGKQISHQIHRLVAMAFIPNPQNYPIINHKNEIKDDNRVENLEWCSYHYNNNYGSLINRNKRKKVICILSSGERKIFNGVNEAGRIMGVSASSISKCCLGKKKQTGGYIWRYL